MITAIDIGNTNIVLGTFENDKLQFIDRIYTDHNITSSEYAVKIRTIFDMHGIKSNDISGSIISSVVPPVTLRIYRAMQKLTGINPLVVGEGLELNLKIKIDSPKTLGSDLKVDAVAALAEYPAPLIIIDMGTATTISVIDSDENYIGGVIIPGLMVSLAALTSKTSQLPNIGLVEPENIIGKNTVECMQSGIMYGTAAQIDGMIERISEKLNKKPTVVATGGIARAVVPLCREKIILDNALLLKGLLLIYKRNITKVL